MMNLSLRNDFTGFATAAFMVWTITAAKATKSVRPPASAKMVQWSPTL